MLKKYFIILMITNISYNQDVRLLPKKIAPPLMNPSLICPAPLFFLNIAPPLMNPSLIIPSPLIYLEHCPPLMVPSLICPTPLIYLEHFVPPPDDLVLLGYEFLEIHHLLLVFKDLVVELHYLVVLVHDLGIHLLDPTLKYLNTYIPRPPLKHLNAPP